MGEPCFRCSYSLGLSCSVTELVRGNASASVYTLIVQLACTSVLCIKNVRLGRAVLLNAAPG